MKQRLGPTKRDRGLSRITAIVADTGKINGEVLRVMGDYRIGHNAMMAAANAGARIFRSKQAS